MSRVNAAVEKIPLIADQEGGHRIAGTDVTLDQVVKLYRAGSTAEAIARRFRPVPLSDIYAVLTYYLRHQEEIDADIQRRHPAHPALDLDAAARERSELLARKHRGHTLSTPDKQRLEALTANLRERLAPFSVSDLEALLEMTDEANQIRQRARERRQEIEVQRDHLWEILYQVSLLLEIEDQPGMLARLTEVITKADGKITQIEAETHETGRMLIGIVCELRDHSQLEPLMRELSAVLGVLRVDQQMKPAKHARRGRGGG